MSISEQFRSRMHDKLRLLYKDQADDVLDRIERLAEDHVAKDHGDLRGRDRRSSLWDERSVVLITYGDQVRAADKTALQAQLRFLLDHELNTLISAIHILPFFPYTSDDGFSIVDYRSVNPSMGQWSDIGELGKHFDTAFDFVVNHCSRRNDWFQRYLKGESPFTEYFIDVDPATDLSAVIRPRNTPLLTPFQTDRGTKYVWTTFSADQVDLNFRSPDVLLQSLEILLFYIRRGAVIIRLDAIGFLWKQLDTTCMHLPETHAIVKLMRDLVDELAPGTILLTETNVPHQENISYFGDGDEAHAVYQFSLAPLLLDAFLTGDAGPLNTWLESLEYPGQYMTYFNFTASHDGIGVRPLEGLVSQPRLDHLVEAVRQRGGLISMRANADGTESPYELNISYVSALDSPEGLPPDIHASRFLASQGVMLSLRGLPGVYFHSLVGTTNDLQGVETTRRNRTINRRKFDRGELRRVLADEKSLQRKVFDGYRRMLAIRIRQPAFHPDADQEVVRTNHKSIMAFIRTSTDSRQNVLILANFGKNPVTIDLAKFPGIRAQQDLLSGRLVDGRQYEIAPHDIAWLT